MPPTALPPQDAALIETCRERSIALLARNDTPHGMLAATPAPRARSRGYLAIFGRDAAICALGMAVSGDAALERAAPAGLVTLAAHQAGNGQIPKLVDASRGEADFWYLGCIDATLWWLIAVALIDRLRPQGLRERFAAEVERALGWLRCQEHPRLRLLQQNEASDWADIMPRSGYVLYTNALWLLAKRLYALPDGEATRRHFNALLHPVAAPYDEYKRARLLEHYVRRGVRRHDLYWSFVNFSFAGDEGDAFGNVLAILCGATGDAAAHRVIRALETAGANDPWPMRSVCTPIRESDALWRPYMARHRQNHPWQYHNGGIWPFIGGFWVAALVEAGLPGKAWGELAKVARANAVGDWAFREWLHGATLAPDGMVGQSWNAGTFLVALNALTAGPARLFARAPCPTPATRLARLRPPAPFPPPSTR